MQANNHDFFKTFDVFFTLLENTSVSELVTVENVMRAFNCAHFIEIAIAKVKVEGKEYDLQNRLREYWRLEERSLSPTYSDLEKACDILLERFLKDNNISMEVVDEYLKLYTQHFRYDRLNAFLNQILSNSICTNTIIESLQKLGVPSSYIEDEALIISWEIAATNGEEKKVIECINKMLSNGHILKLVQFVTKTHDGNAIRKLLLQSFTSKLVENHTTICIALIGIKRKLFLGLLQSDHNFCMTFIDTIFYFGRNMQQVNGKWLSNYDFKYEHLCKVMQILINGPHTIYNLICNRLTIAKSQPDSAIWNDIEKYIL